MIAHVHILGSRLPVVIAEAFDERLVWVNDGMVHVYPNSVRGVEELIKKYKERESKRYLLARVRKLSIETGLEARRISFRYQKTRWGSCSSEKDLSLNVRLFDLHPSLIDYVILHELAHTQELNHSRNFWNIVARHCPNFRLLQKQLNKIT